MANSTTIITDITSVITNGAKGNTPAQSIAPSGYIMDYPGNVNLCLTKFKEIKALMKLILANTDQTQDSTNYTLLNNIYSDLS